MPALIPGAPGGSGGNAGGASGSGGNAGGTSGSGGNAGGTSGSGDNAGGASGSGDNAGGASGSGGNAGGSSGSGDSGNAGGSPSSGDSGNAGRSPNSGREDPGGTPGGSAGTSSNGMGGISSGSSGGGTSGEPGDGSGGNLLSRLAPPSTDRKPPSPRPLPVRPGRQFADRDWIILIECTAEGLVLQSSGQKVPAAKLPRKTGDSNPLLEAVQKMIDRRQALVPAGEPPYSPRIRFLVRPEGLRAYYLAYPALELLQLPMTRQEMGRDDDRR